MATCIILQTQRQLDLAFHPKCLPSFLSRTGLSFGMRDASKSQNGPGTPTEEKDMREKIQNDALGQKAQASSSSGFSATLAAVGGYWKLALGILLVTLLVVFVAQNANAIHVKFLVWEANMSQALVVFLSLLSGVVFGVAFNRWQRWRSSRVRR
jgi:uncharacterized integral membrane protein